jgi:glycosyltransferase involved in cell wall biosynthesis
MTERPHISALMVVRNEADILPINLLHHFSAGIDHVFAVDNGSSDETPDILEQFAREGRLTWRRDTGTYRQSALTTELARHAHQQGADWVIPIDADEFWHAPDGSLAEILSESQAGALLVDVINFVQRRDQQRAGPDCLLYATRRAPIPIGPLEAIRDHVENREYGFVEMKYQPKYVSRASAAIEIDIGNHHVHAVDGAAHEPTDRILCLHVPLRSRETLEAKVEHGERLAALGLDPMLGWHVLRWSRLRADELDAEWRANSYDGNHLDVFGRAHPLVFDPSLRDLVRPWIDGEGVASACGQDGTGHTEIEELKRTIQRQLQAALRVESRVREELAATHARIGELQQELFQKVGEANVVIRDLQVQMHTKIKQANEVIDLLQARLASESPPREE